MKSIIILLLSVSTLTGTLACKPDYFGETQQTDVFRDKTSRLKGYKVVPYALGRTDHKGHVRIWYKDLPSVFADIKQQAKLTYEKKRVTYGKYLQIPAGGLLVVEVLRPTSTEAELNKFMIIVKQKGEVVLKQTLTDTSPKHFSRSYNSVDYQYGLGIVYNHTHHTYWNAEIVPLPLPVFHLTTVIVVDLVTRKQYKYYISPHRRRIKKVKKAIRFRQKVQRRRGNSPKNNTRMF